MNTLMNLPLDKERGYSREVSPAGVQFPLVRISVNPEPTSKLEIEFTLFLLESRCFQCPLDRSLDKLNVKKENKATNNYSIHIAFGLSLLPASCFALGCPNIKGTIISEFSKTPILLSTSGLFLKR